MGRYRKAAAASASGQHSQLVWENRLYRGDCKEAAEILCGERVGVDLIYLDPPFNSNKVYNTIFRAGGKDAQEVAFLDTWQLAPVEQMRMAFMDALDSVDGVSEHLKALMRMWVKALLNGNNDDRRLVNYLVYMTERLITLRRLLSPRGSIYLHCDPTASHYLKVMMDAVFGRQNFRNEIVWCYSNSGRGNRTFARKHDIILFYTATADYHFDYRIPVSEKYLKSHYRQFDDDGQRCRIRTDGGKTRIYYPEDGMICNDWWSDIPPVNSQAKERRHYPTQKPLPLVERIIEASCPPDGVVLDPFCGCGTTIEAAHRLKRRWIGMDISTAAITDVKSRASQMGLREKADFSLTECRPKAMADYEEMNPWRKQDFLVRSVGGSCGPKGSDGGVDGTIRIHIGGDDKEARWGDMPISVKTGKQANPAHVRELLGVMTKLKSEMGLLIMDAKPTPAMLEEASRAGKFRYRTGHWDESFPRLQILTAQDILDGQGIRRPRSLAEVKAANIAESTAPLVQRVNSR